jgi:hypothetical protein
MFVFTMKRPELLVTIGSGYLTVGYLQAVVDP